MPHRIEVGSRAIIKNLTHALHQTGLRQGQMDTVISIHHINGIRYAKLSHGQLIPCGALKFVV